MNLISIDLGVRNLAVCCLSLKNGIPSIVSWELIDCTHGVTMNLNDASIESLVSLITSTYLRKREDWVGDSVLIEQQPMGGRTFNIKTKVLGHVLQSLFELDGKSVRFVSPQLKLRGMSSGGYADNKAYAVSKTREMLVSHCSEWVSWFDSQKKKDDVADAFLQGVYSGLAGDANPRPSKRKRKISLPAIQDGLTNDLGT